jgi:hypothetical protein
VGSSFLFIKVSLDGLGPVQIVLARMCAGAIVLGAFLAIRREQLPRQPALWAHIAVAAHFANIVPYFLRPGRGMTSVLLHRRSRVASVHPSTQITGESRR